MWAAAHRLRSVRPGASSFWSGAWQASITWLSLSFLICEMGQQHFLPCRVKICTLSTNSDKYCNSHSCTETSQGLFPTGVCGRVPSGKDGGRQQQRRDGSGLQSDMAQTCLHAQAPVCTPTHPWCTPCMSSLPSPPLLCLAGPEPAPACSARRPPCATWVYFHGCFQLPPLVLCSSFF